MLLSVLTIRGKVSRLNLHLRSRPWLREGNLHLLVTLPSSVPPAPSLGLPTSAEEVALSYGSLRARSPDPEQWASPRGPGAQDTAGPLTPQASQTSARGPKPCRRQPVQMAAAIASQRGRQGRGSLPP